MEILTPVLGTVLGLVAGVATGAGARLLLGRLDRGVIVRPPWCELAVGGLWALGGASAFGGAVPLWWLPVQLAVAWFTVALVAVDVRHRRLPDALTLPAYPVAGLVLAPAVLAGPGPPLVGRAVGGAALFLAVHLVVRAVSPTSLGAGDVKLSGSLGAVAASVSWGALPVVAVVAAVITAIVGALSRRFSGVWEGGSVIPHGPGLLLATLLVVVIPASEQPVLVPGVPRG
ncbi:prepilin peptidase [Allokutzneria oryzae]|uniref:Prepilin peptidase n=1 Tax=Allokutzneria oryzae TaxID=1378989 RepID=A0ABV5ZTM0_9PSEU